MATKKRQRKTHTSKKSNTISFWINAEHLKFLNAEAKRLKITRNKLIELILKDQLKLRK